MRRRGPKRLTPQQVTGPLGVNLVERILLQMGFPWHPTRQELEGGIDGFIEIRDPATGNLTNTVLKAQIKTTTKKWSHESSTEFSYRCDARDIDYWMSGDNQPVLLIVVRPSGDEAYWANVREVFSDPQRRKDQWVRFDKATQRLSSSSARDLMNLGSPRDSGLYIPAMSVEETLISNLLPVTSLPPHIYVASTDYRDPKDVIAWAKDSEVQLPSGWFLGDKLIYSFHDLREGMCREIWDVGSVETFGTDEWSDSDDPDRQRQFVRLLNQVFRGDMRIRRLWRSKDEKCYYFPSRRGPNDEPQPRTYWYRSLQQKTSSEVVKVEPDRNGDGIWYCRHDAFQHAFLRINDGWHLVITPHYVFTTDGRTPHPHGEELLSGLKRQERQKAVLGQVVMWRHKLTEQRGQMRLGEGEREQPLIGFGDLTRLSCPRGINDADWLPSDSGDEAEGDDSMDGGLFA